MALSYYTTVIDNVTNSNSTSLVAAEAGKSVHVVGLGITNSGTAGHTIAFLDAAGGNQIVGPMPLGQFQPYYVASVGIPMFRTPQGSGLFLSASSAMTANGWIRWCKG